MIAEECALVLSAGLPIWGVCWYPVLNRPDWDYLDDWHHSGLWEDKYDAFNKSPRQPHTPTIQAFFESQALLKRVFSVS
jgi:hypothetical protein